MIRNCPALLVGFFMAALGACCCQPSETQLGTNTNWMKLCDESAECGSDLSCECGRCTLPCTRSSQCPEDAACSPSLSTRVQCGGENTATCQPLCDRDDDCEGDRLCLAGVCTDSLVPLDCPPEALYCADFEDVLGEEVTEVVTDGNILAQKATTTPSGAGALEIQVSEGPSVAYLRADLPNQPTGSVFVSGWVRVPRPEAHNVAPIALWAAAEEAWALRLVIVDSRLEVWSNTAPLGPSADLEVGSWHCLQMEVDVADAPDGEVTVKVDGEAVGTASEVDTLPEGGIDAVALGTLWAASAAELWVDRVVVSTAPIDCFR